MPSKTKSEKRRFQDRMAMRACRHGKNWRQVVVDCGGMCLKCYAVDCLEFHEPFGEDKFGWSRFQSRVLLCNDCHTDEHQVLLHGEKFIRASKLMGDIDIEIMLENGYDNWIRNHHLIDRFAWLICQKGD